MSCWWKLQKHVWTEWKYYQEIWTAWGPSRAHYVGKRCIFCDRRKK